MKKQREGKIDEVCMRKAERKNTERKKIEKTTSKEKMISID
jgi:hypothetical protein